jgi:hypothetical protein
VILESDTDLAVPNLRDIPVDKEDAGGAANAGLPTIELQVARCTKIIQAEYTINVKQTEKFGLRRTPTAEGYRGAYA